MVAAAWDALAIGCQWSRLPPSTAPNGSPALAGTALATIKGWGAVRLEPGRQAQARASRFAPNMRKFNQLSLITSSGAPL